MSVQHAHGCTGQRHRSAYCTGLRVGQRFEYRNIRSEVGHVLHEIAQQASVCTAN
jgi:hypothetical protein